MSTWDDLKSTLYSAGKDISQKAKDVSGIAKLKLDIKSKEDFVEKQYAALGKAYYMAHKDEEGAEEAAQFAVITEALEDIEKMQLEIINIQGATACPRCGASMSENATFCSKCGAKMNDMYED